MIITIGSKVKDGEGNTYTLTEELGHGGFGCVYKAECEADKSVYAVKTLLYSFGDEVTAASFKNEVKISSEVSGEHVIHYIYAHDGDEYPELPPIIIFVFLLLTRFFSHFHFFIEIFSKSMSFPLAMNHGYTDV